MEGERVDWQWWVDDRWSSDRVPKRLCIVDAGCAEAAVARYCGHKNIKELALINNSAETMPRILKALHKNLEFITVMPWPESDKDQIFELLREHNRVNGCQ
ncbi:hypothetical protein HK101_007582 [Irineochytrium annulatum]|nr:hypothetical protein HK101_007582 [Irineochytrium annulatum]